MEEIYKQDYKHMHGGSGEDFSGGYGGGRGGGHGDGKGSSGGSGLGSLNEEDYINKLYGDNVESEKKLIEQNYTDNTTILNSEKEHLGQQTQQSIDRTQVEANNDTMTTFNGKNLSLGAAQQAALVQENTKQGNLNRLNEQRAVLEAEYERQRQLLASQYESAIKQAQLDNDMAKAQALYKAAQKEDQQLMDTMLKQLEIYSTYGEEEDAKGYAQRLVFGGVPSADLNSGKTSSEVLKYEDEIQKAYDSKYESQKLELQNQLEKSLSDLTAKLEEAERQTDEKLTETYTDALQNAMNYAEVQNARGMGSGVYGQAQLAQDTELRDTLTDLRLSQLEKDANYGVQNLDAYKSYSTDLQKKQAAINLERAIEMLAAAETVEERNIAMEELKLQYMLMTADDDSGGGGGGGGSSGGGSSGGGGTLVERANAAYHSGENMTQWLESESSGGKMSDGTNLTDYLAVYT